MIVCKICNHELIIKNDSNIAICSNCKATYQVNYSENNLPPVEINALKSKQKSKTNKRKKKSVPGKEDNITNYPVSQIRFNFESWKENIFLTGFILGIIVTFFSVPFALYNLETKQGVYFYGNLSLYIGIAILIIFGFLWKSCDDYVILDSINKTVSLHKQFLFISSIYNICSLEQVHALVNLKSSYRYFDLYVIDLYMPNDKVITSNKYTYLKSNGTEGFGSTAKYQELHNLADTINDINNRNKGRI